MTPAPRTSEPIVALQGVTKHFASGTLALDGVDLAIASGEFVSLLGPSGCGKSTALRLIAGLGEPTHRRHFVERDQAGRAAQRARCRLRVPGPDPDAVVDGGKATWRCRSRSPASPTMSPAKRVAQALEQVGLAQFRDAYPRELSGGMKMRVSIARGLVTDPPLLLMDEPFAALDEITRFKLNDELIALWRAVGNTVVFVTHSVFESVYLSSRIVVMTPRPGRIFADLRIDAPFPRDESFRTSRRICRLLPHRVAGAGAGDGAAGAPGVAGGKP